MRTTPKSLPSGVVTIALLSRRSRNLAASFSAPTFGRTVDVGNLAHTVTSDPSNVADPDGVSVPDGIEPWDSGLLGAGETFTRTFKRPGTYEYVCIPHEGARMVDTVIVEGR